MGIVDLLALSLRERQGKRVDDDNLERIMLMLSLQAKRVRPDAKAINNL